MSSAQRSFATGTSGDRLRRDRAGNLLPQRAQVLNESWRRVASARDAADLRALKGQIVHRPRRAVDGDEDRARETVCIDRATGAERHDGHGSVDADLPAIDVL